MWNPLSCIPRLIMHYEELMKVLPDDIEESQQPQQQEQPPGQNSHGPNDNESSDQVVHVAATSETLSNAVTSPASSPSGHKRQQQKPCSRQNSIYSVHESSIMAVIPEHEHDHHDEEAYDEEEEEDIEVAGHGISDITCLESCEMGTEIDIPVPHTIITTTSTIASSSELQRSPSSLSEGSVSCTEEVKTDTATTTTTSNNETEAEAEAEVATQSSQQENDESNVDEHYGTAPCPGRLRECLDSLVHLGGHILNHWMCILLVQVAIPVLALIAPFFVDLRQSGEHASQGFLSGVEAYYKAFYIGALLATSHMALDDNLDGTRIPTWVWAIAFPTLLALVMIGGWIFSAGVLVLLLPTIFIAPLLYLLTPDRKRHAETFLLLGCLLLAFFNALLVVGGWAALMVYLSDKSRVSRVAVSALFEPLRFVCKNVQTARIAEKLNPRKAPIFVFVVDITFEQVQQSTFPYISFWYQFVVMILGVFVSMLWKFYCGADRTSLCCATVVGPNFAKDKKSIPERHASVHKKLGHSVRHLTTGCMMAPISQISRMSRSLRNADRGYLQRCSSSSTRSTMALSSTHDLEDSPSTNSVHAMEEGRTHDEEDDGESSTTFDYSSPSESQESDEEEQSCLQRPMYQIVDAVGRHSISLAIRIGTLAKRYIAPKLPASEDLKKPFLPTKEQHWNDEATYTVVYIGVALLCLAILGKLFIQSLEVEGHDKDDTTTVDQTETLDEVDDASTRTTSTKDSSTDTKTRQKITFDRVMRYLFGRDTYCSFFTLWLTAAGALLVMNMIEHF